MFFLGGFKCGLRLGGREGLWVKKKRESLLFVRRCDAEFRGTSSRHTTDSKTKKKKKTPQTGRNLLSY